MTENLQADGVQSLCGIAIMETALHGLRFAKTVQGCSVVYCPKLYAVFP